MKIESKWECTKCARTYESPVTGTKSITHTPKSSFDPAHVMKRVWQSRNDKK